MAFTPAGIEFISKGLSVYLDDLNRANRAQLIVGDTATESSTGLGKMGTAITAVGAAAAAAAVAGVAALAAGLKLSIDTAISFESAFAGVIKTTDGITDSTGKLNQAGEELRAGFVNLSKEIPLTFEELAKIGELGGQLGVGKDSIVEFSETIAALGVSTNLTTEEAATSIARFQNIYQVATDDVGKNTNQVGSAIVALGNNFATTERDIVAFAERIAGAGKIAGLTQSDVLAIGTALSSVGVEAEAGGTAVQKVLLEINNAVNGATTGFVDNTKAMDKNAKAVDSNLNKLTKLQATSARLEAEFPGLQAELLAQRDAFLAAGGSAEEWGRQLGDKNRQQAFETAQAIELTKGAISDLNTETELLISTQGQPVPAGQLEKFAQVAGIAADEFKAKWEEDAAGAFQLFVEGLAREGDNAVNVLEGLGLADQRLIRSFLSLSGAGDLLGRTFDLSNDAFEEGTALQKEAAARYATTESQIQLLKNTLRAMGDTVGSAFLPMINEALRVTREWLDSVIIPLGEIINNAVVPAITNFVGSLSELFSTAQEGGSIFDNFLSPEALQTTITNIIASIPTALTNLVTSITSFLTTQWPVIMATLNVWATNFWDWVETAATNAGSSLLAIIASVQQWITNPDTQAQLLEAGNALGNAVVDGLIFFAENASEYAEVMTAIAGGLAAATVAIIGLLGLIGGQILAGIWQGILERVGIDLEVATIGELGAIYGGIATNALTAAKIIGINAVLGIIEGLREYLEELYTVLDLAEAYQGAADNALLATKLIGQNIVSGVVEGVETAVSKIEQAGKFIIDGLINGMEQNAAAVLEYIKGLMGDVWAQMKDFWDSDSPSKLAAGLGSDIMLGLTRGVTTKSETFRTAVLDAVNPKQTLKDLDQYNKTNRRVVENFFKKRLGDFGNLTPQKLQKELTIYADQFGIPAKELEKYSKEIEGQSKKFLRQIKKVEEQTRIANIGGAITTGLSFGSFAEGISGRLGQEINQLRAFLRSGDETTTLGNNILNTVEAQELLNQKMAEQVNLQKELGAIAKAEAELGFLQQQIQIIDLVKQRGLNVQDIFGGIQFGLNASIPDLVMAANRAVQAVVGQVSADFGALSPSVSPAQEVSSSGGGGNVVIEGPVNINNGMDMNMFTTQVQQAAQGLA